MISTRSALAQLGAVVVILLAGCNGTATNGDGEQPLPSVWEHPAVVERQAVRIPLDHAAAVGWLFFEPGAPGQIPDYSIHAQQRQAMLTDLAHLNLFRDWILLRASNSQETLLREARKTKVRMALLLEPVEMTLREDGTARVAVRARLFDLQMEPPYPLWRRNVESMVGPDAVADPQARLRRAWWDVRGKLIAELYDWHDTVRGRFSP